MLFKKLRYRLSFAFGRMEHLYSRILFWTLLLTLGLMYFSKYNIAFYMSIANIAVWGMYYVSHRMEKYLHPKKGNVRI